MSEELTEVEMLEKRIKVLKSMVSCLTIATKIAILNKIEYLKHRIKQIKNREKQCTKRQYKQLLN